MNLDVTINRRMCGVALAVITITSSGYVAPSTSASHSQSSSKWHRYTAPDKSFQISTPKRLRHFKDPEIKWADFYAETRFAEECRQPLYAVVVANLRGNEQAEERVWDLYFLIGGSHADPTKEINISVRGYEAREYFYASLLSSGCKYRRGRTVNGDQVAFIVIFGSNQRRDLTSRSTQKFFDSFTPRSRRFTK